MNGFRRKWQQYDAIQLIIQKSLDVPRTACFCTNLFGHSSPSPPGRRQCLGHLPEASREGNGEKTADLLVNTHS
jgi:hypothetical protein